VVFCVPGTLLFGYLLYTAFVAAPSGAAGLGWYSFALAAPLPAPLLAGLPSVRSWVAARKRF
jgi:hypothetical protein